MRTIKLFEEFHSKYEITTICEKYGIENYTINTDGSIDVDNNVYLGYSGFNKLPLKFNKVSGDFYCNNNELINLEGCPTNIGGDFSCDYNKLVSLDGGPNYIGGNFNCNGNPVYTVWRLIDDKDYLELLIDYDIFRDDNIIILDKLNDLLDMMDRPKVKKVDGYKCI